MDDTQVSAQSTSDEQPAASTPTDAPAESTEAPAEGDMPAAE